MPIKLVPSYPCDQWPKLHLDLDALSSQKILKGVYSVDSFEWPKWMLNIFVNCGLFSPKLSGIDPHENGIFFSESADAFIISSNI